MRVLLAASFLGHVFFYICGSFSPRFLGIQVMGAVAVASAAFASGDHRLLALPVGAAHAWGFFLFRKRPASPVGTPAFRRFEDLLYALHGGLAAAALLV